MQETVLFDIAQTSIDWSHLWPALILLLGAWFPVLAYLVLGEHVEQQQRRVLGIVCGALAAVIFSMWLLFVGGFTLSVWLDHRQRQADRASDRLVSIEGRILPGASASAELGGGGGALTTFHIRDDQGVSHTFQARLTQGNRLNITDLRPNIVHGGRFRVSYLPSDRRDQQPLVIVALDEARP